MTYCVPLPMSIVLLMPVDMRADLLLRAVEEGSIDRDQAQDLATCYRCLYELRARLGALTAFASATVSPGGKS